MTPEDPETADIVDTLRNGMEEAIVEACDDASADEDYTGAARDIRSMLQQHATLGDDDLANDLANALAADAGEMLRGVCPDEAEDILDEL